MKYTTEAQASSFRLTSQRLNFESIWRPNEKTVVIWEQNRREKGIAGPREVKGSKDSPKICSDQPVLILVSFSFGDLVLEKLGLVPVSDSPVVLLVNLGTLHGQSFLDPIVKECWAWTKICRRTNIAAFNSFVAWKSIEIYCLSDHCYWSKSLSPVLKCNIDLSVGFLVIYKYPSSSWESDKLPSWVVSVWNWQSQETSEADKQSLKTLRQSGLNHFGSWAFENALITSRLRSYWQLILLFLSRTTSSRDDPSL